MSKTLFLFGNGLSMALSPDFSLKNITTKFIDSLDGDDKRFLEELCSKDAGLSFDNFEQNFAQLEASYDNLHKYRIFIESDVGQKFLQRFGLQNPDLIKHEIIIERIYKSYISRILELIHGNVRLEVLNQKLPNFINFLLRQTKENEMTFIFTLNYDLLAETILLQFLGTEYFTDFCCPSGKLKETEINKFDFNPKRNEEYFPGTQQTLELHHLHGSLSLFYDYNRNRVIKLKSQDIGYEEIYKRIYDDKLPLIPAIITGGGKSDKIVQYPFDFFYRSMKDICDLGEASKFYIIGYSFRDEHINDLIIRWTKSVEDYTNGLLIVDYKINQNDQEEFKSIVRKTIKKRPQIPDKCFIFNGAESIIDVVGTIKKHKENKAS